MINMRRSAFVLSLTAALGAVVLLSACSGGGGDALEERATAHMRVKRNLGAQVNLEYEFTVQWNGQGPNSGDGTGSINKTQTYQGYTDTNGDAKEGELFLDLRAGNWTFSISMDGWSTNCSQTLTAGQQHFANFTYNESGCTTGAVF